MDQKPWQISDTVQNQIVEEVHHNDQIQQDPIMGNDSNYNTMNSYGGGMYGMGGYGGMGFGGMGMYGLGMSMAGMDQNGFLFQSLRALESASFMVNSLAQLTRTMECNAQGLFTKIKNWIVNSIKMMKTITVKSIDFVLVLLKLKQKMQEQSQQEYLGLSDTEIELKKLKKKEKILKQIFNISLSIFATFLIFVNFWNYHLSKQVSINKLNPVALFTRQLIQSNQIINKIQLIKYPNIFQYLTNSIFLSPSFLFILFL